MIKNVLLCFWLPNRTTYRNLTNFLKFWLNYGYLKSQKTLYFSTFKFLISPFGYVQPGKKKGRALMSLGERPQNLYLSVDKRPQNLYSPWIKGHKCGPNLIGSRWHLR